MGLSFCRQRALSGGDLKVTRTARLKKFTLSEGTQKKDGMGKFSLRTKWQMERLTCFSLDRKRWNSLLVHTKALNMLEDDYPETFEDTVFADSFFVLDMSARSWQAVGKKHGVYRISRLSQICSLS